MFQFFRHLNLLIFCAIYYVYIILHTERETHIHTYTFTAHSLFLSVFWIFLYNYPEIGEKK